MGQQIKALIKKLSKPLLQAFNNFWENNISYASVKELNGGGHVVLSLPKCGGSTINQTIVRAFPFLRVYHIHALSVAGMRKFSGENVELTKKGYHGLVKSIEVHLLGAARFKIVGLKNSKSVYVVSGIRDPVALAISLFFQNYDYHIDAGCSIDCDHVLDFVVRDVFNKGLLAGGIDEWFENEIEKELGFNLLEESFDPEIGYRVYEKRGDINHRLLLLKLESFDKVSEALGELYEVPPQLFGLANANTSGQKKYKSVYDQILKEIHFDIAFLDEMYSSRYVKKFYSEIEIKKMKKRWLRV